MIILLTILKILFWLLILIILGFSILYYCDKKLLRTLLRPLIIKEKEPAPKEEEVHEHSQVDTEISKLRKDLFTKFENRLSAMQEANCDKFASMDRQIVLLSSELNALKEEISNLKKDSLKKVEEKQKPPVDPLERSKFGFQQRVYYTRLVDSLNPLGFFVENLQEKPEGCCFLINIISSDRANYACVNDKYIQQEMVAAFNPVLTNSSEYEIVPQKIDSIEVVNKGELVLSGNIWKIIRKQTIKFH